MQPLYLAEIDSTISHSTIRRHPQNLKYISALSRVEDPVTTAGRTSMCRKCRAVWTRGFRMWVRFPAFLLWGNNLGQVVHTHVLLSSSSKGTVQMETMRMCTTRKVTVGLASHWPRVTGLSIPGSRPKEGRWPRRLFKCRGLVHCYLHLYWNARADRQTYSHDDRSTLRPCRDNGLMYGTRVYRKL